MKRHAMLVLLCLAFAGCSKAPGGQETGYQGMPWGTTPDAVAKDLHVTAKAAAADSLFGDVDRASPRAGALLGQGLSKLITGKGGADVDGVAVLKGASRLDTASGYCLFFDQRLGMALHNAAAKTYQGDHDRLMKRYGVIDKKVQYRANEYDSSYLIQWHDADGIIILAREIYGNEPTERHTSVQIIHMDKKLFDTLSSQLK